MRSVQFQVVPLVLFLQDSIYVKKKHIYDAESQY